MDIQIQITALEDLASADAEIAELEKELAGEREALGGRQQRLLELDARLAASRASMDEMDRTRHDLIGEARQMSLQLERSREKLSRCRNEREANAVQRELEELRKLYRDREVELQKLQGLAEQAQADIEVATGQREEVASELGQTQGARITRLQELEGVLAAKSQVREELTKRLPPVLYRRYDRIRSRKGTGLAHTTTGTCSACHIALAPMHFQTLRRRVELDQCPNCARILYFRPEPSDESTNDG